MARQTVGSLVVGDESRKERKVRLSAEKRARKRLAEQTKAARAHIRNRELEAWKGDFIAPTGEKRANAGRVLRREYIKKFSASTRTLRTTFPFLADRGLGPHGMFMGYELISRGAFCFDPWQLYMRGVITNPNIAVAGVVGTGKSALCKSLATRALAFGRSTYIPGDVKGEWSPVVKAHGGVVIEVGPGSPNRLNPLDPGVRPDVDPYGRAVDDHTWAIMVERARAELLVALASTTLGRELSPEEHTALSVALSGAGRENDIVLIPQIATRLLSPRADEVPAGVVGVEHLADLSRPLGHALQRLITGDMSGVFDGPSTVAFDTSAPMVSVDLKNIAQHSKTLPLVMTCTAAWMEGSLRDPKAGKRFVIYDEAHRLMSDDALLNRMKEQWKLARGWGISNVLVLHRLSDLDAVGDQGSKSRALAEGLLADASTRIVLRQESDQLQSALKILGLSQTSAQTISSLRRGQALWQVGQNPYLVEQDYTASELELFDTDSAMRGEPDEG